MFAVFAGYRGAPKSMRVKRFPMAGRGRKGSGRKGEKRMIAETFVQPSRYQQLREHETQKEKNHAIFAPFPSLQDVKTLFMPRSKSLNLEELQALLASYQSQQAQLEFQMRQNAGIIANLEKERDALEKKREKNTAATGRKASAKRGTSTRQRAAAAKTGGASTTARTVKAAAGRKKAASSRGTAATRAPKGAQPKTGAAVKKTVTKAKPAARKSTAATKTKTAAAKAKASPAKTKTAAAKAKASPAKAKTAAAKAKASPAKAKTAAAKAKASPAKAKTAAAKRATPPRKSAVSAASATPVKATKADKGGYRLSDWDQVLIEAVNKARQPLKKTELDALFQGHDLAKKAKMDDEAVYTKVSRVLHKLANKRGILKKVPTEGKGFAYTLA
jgi:hypothetical protein